MSIWGRILFTVVFLSAPCLIATKAMAAPDYSRNLNHLFDITKAGSVDLVLPTDVEINKSGIYIVDSGNNRVVVFDHQGKFLFSFGRQGSGRGEFLDPVGLGLGKNGQIYVADTGNHRIQIFSNKGQFKNQINILDGKTPVRPIDVVSHPDTGYIYVSGNNNHKLMVYSRQGKKVTEWGGNGANSGKFRYPATIALTKDSDIAVVDVLNSRIQLFQPDGRFLVNIGKWGVLPGQLFRPKGVAADRHGQIYVSDSYMNLIQVFHDSGKLLHVLRPRGKRKSMMSPTGIAVRNKHLYVSEMLRHRVSVFKLE